MAITAVAAPIVFGIGVVVVCLSVGMLEGEWLIRQGIQQFVARVDW